MSDSGHAAGNQVYPDQAPDCDCGHAEVLHKLYAGERRQCGVGGVGGRCPCLAYVARGDVGNPRLVGAPLVDQGGGDQQ